MSPSIPALGRIMAALALLAGASGIAAAAAEPTTRIRGMIERVDGPVLTIATREGASVRLTLAPDAKVAGMVPADLTDAGAGSFIGPAAVPQPDGRLKAQEVLIFP